MKKNEIKNLNESELHNKLESSHTEFMDLRFKKKEGALKNVRMMRNLRKDIARIKTILALKEKKNV